MAESSFEHGDRARVTPPHSARSGSRPTSTNR